MALDPAGLVLEDAQEVLAVAALLQRPSQALELYDLEADLSETNDVSAQNPEVVAQLEAFLETVRTESPLWPLEPE